jgi:hypothetical protein
MLYVDTREKPHAIEGILNYFDRIRLKYEKQKLDIGDYQMADNPFLVIDRKRNLSEICQNLSCGTDRTKSGDVRRFMNEVRLAHERGVKLIVLCEHGGQIHSLKDVANWHNPMLDKYPFAITGRDLMERMYRVHISYGVEFLFCSKRSTGRVIAELLGAKKE